jgi:hypothetical protein
MRLAFFSLAQFPPHCACLAQRSSGSVAARLVISLSADSSAYLTIGAEGV